MTTIRFEWDESTNRSNQRKHGISFEEASQVFLDPLRLVVADRVIDGEERWQTFGMVKRQSGNIMLVLVAHTTPEEQETGTFVEVVRIISARRTSRKERSDYEEKYG